jgi:hypothetical protein
MSGRPACRPVVGKYCYVEGTKVAFERRDIAQATDDEMRRIKTIVEREQDAEAGRDLEELVIESDYVDRDFVRYRTTTRVLARILDAQDPSPVM